MSGRLQEASDRFAVTLARVREWLRRAMPRVAVAAAALFILRLLICDTELYRSTPVRFLGLCTFLAVAATVIYYSLKILVRLKRMLLWKVRRRLMVTTWTGRPLERRDRRLLISRTTSSARACRSSRA
jgi:hypothetical protein